jgi:hypothetical protein
MAPAQTRGLTLVSAPGVASRRARPGLTRAQCQLLNVARLTATGGAEPQPRAVCRTPSAVNGLRVAAEASAQRSVDPTDRTFQPEQ